MPVDQQILRTLGANATPGFLASLTQTFLKHTEFLLEEMRVALVQNNFETLQRAAHSLKSSSAAIGAMPLAHLCKNLEQDCLRQNYATLTQAVQALSTEFAKVTEYLHEHID